VATSDTFKEFDSYRVVYGSVRGNIEGRPDIETSRCYSSIECLKEKQTVAIIYFQDSPKINLNYYDPEQDIMFIYFHISSFYDIINIIQNEKPLAVGLNADLTGYINTTGEPIGKQEQFH